MKWYVSVATMVCIGLSVMGLVIASHRHGCRLAQASSNPQIIDARERNSIDEHGIFEKYDNSKTATGRRERLDAFASYLKENPHFQAYIMSYGGRRTFLREAKTRSGSAVAGRF